MGVQGINTGQFGSAIADLAIDPDGYVYVADETVIHKFARDGRFVTAFGGAGSENGQFKRILDIAVDPAFNVYAIDVNTAAPEARIQVFAAVS